MFEETKAHTERTFPMCPFTTCYHHSIPLWNWASRVKCRWTSLMTLCLAFSADHSLLNYVYDAGSVSTPVWSEAGSQEATRVQGGTWESQDPSSENPGPGGDRFGQHGGSWHVHPDWWSGQIHSWTSNHPFLIGSRRDYCVVWALLCRVDSQSKITSFWVFRELCHNGTTVRLHHWLEPLTVFNYWWDDGARMGIKMEKVGEMTGGFTHWSELCYPPSGQSWERGNGGRKTAQPHYMQVYPAFLKWWTEKPEERSCGEWVRGRQVPRLIPWPQWSLRSAVAFLDFPLHLNLKIQLWSSPS